jgi:hypothetical protein
MSGGPVSIPQADAELHPVIERITGHSVDIEFLFWPITGPEGECCGGHLTVGSARIWLDPDHASNLADRVRAAIDQAVLSNFPSPANQRRLS